MNYSLFNFVFYSSCLLLVLRCPSMYFVWRCSGDVRNPTGNIRF